MVVLTRKRKHGLLAACSCKGRMQGKWALVTVDVTPVQPQWVGCCHGGARSSRQSRRVAAAVVVQCPIFCWQIKSPEPLNAVMLLDEPKIRGGRVSSPGPTPQGQLPRYSTSHSHQFASSRARGPGLPPSGQDRVLQGLARTGRSCRHPVLKYCRRVCASGRGAALAGGVLNAAKLTQDWPRGRAFPTGWQGQVAVPLTQSLSSSRASVCCRCSPVQEVASYEQRWPCI